MEQTVTVNGEEMVFNLHGGVGNFPSLDVDEIGLDTQITAPVTNPTREGYRFLGWFITEDGTNSFPFPISFRDLREVRDVLNVEFIVNNIEAGQGTFVYHVHAQWEPMESSQQTEHTVEFNLHGGTGNFPLQRVEHGQLVLDPILAPTPPEIGWCFRGWFTEPNSLGTGLDPAAVQFDFNAPIVEDTVIHAHWFGGGWSGCGTVTVPVNRPEVAFNLHGGTGNIPNVTTGAQGIDTQVTAPITNPTREGYHFLGWFTTETGDNSFPF